MTLEEACRQIKASYIHHINERNAILLSQAESIAMDCIQKVIDAQNLEQCIVEHDISFDAFCIYCQDLLNSAKERLERTLSYGETSEYRISELKSAIRLQEQLLGYMTELKEAKRLVAQLKAKLCDSSEYCAYCDELDISECDHFTCKYKKKKIPAVCYWQVLTPAHFDDIPWTKNEV